MSTGKMHTVEICIPMHQRARQGNEPVDLWVSRQIETMKTTQLYRVSCKISIVLSNRRPICDTSDTMLSLWGMSEQIVRDILFPKTSQ
jgi:hypothetical protein